MSDLSRDQFIACLKKSTAMDDEAVDSWMSRVDDKDPKKIATKLVRDKMLTQWQAKVLLSGRSRLTVGNYRLLSRINRSELGDRFEAIHSQLGRKVVIQIFPSSINKNDELRARVLKAMQKMTELDHPSLVHVYDVDQEGDRYFVVTEFIDGTVLSDLPRGDLKDSDVASVIADLITGVKYAHQKDVIHGSILQENVLVTAQGRGKLQGLSTSAVQCEMTDSSGKLSHQQDFNAISRLGCSVLQEVPPKRRGEGYDTLVKAVGALASAEGSALEKVQLKLAQWLAKHGPKQPVAKLGGGGALASAKSIEGADDVASVQPVDPLAAQQGSSDAPVAALPTTKLTKKSEQAPESESESAGFLLSMWNEKRALSLAAIAATVLAFVGGIGAAGSLLTQPASTRSDTAVAKGTAPVANTASNKTGSVAAYKQPKKFKIEKLAAGDGLLSAARPEDALDPEATKRKFEAMYANRNAVGGPPSAAAVLDQPPITPDEANTPDEVDTSNEPATPEEAKAARIAARRKARKEAAKEAATASEAMPSADALVAAESEETKTAANTKSPAVETEAVETAMAKPAAEPVKVKTPATPKSNPFASLPETVDLPLSTETNDVKIADVEIDKRYLMGLELLAGPEICKHKFVFDLKRSATDKQLWDIRMQRRKRDDPLPVAQIQKTPTELKFRWLPAAEKFEDANYIRNCKIKLTAAKDFGWIGLRKPMVIESFAFEPGRASVKTDIELKWLPKPQGVRIELSPFQISVESSDRKMGKISFNPRYVTKRDPGRIFFHQDEKLQFFFVEVGIDVRSKVKMDAQMFLLGANGTPQAMRKVSDVSNLAGLLSGRQAEADRFLAVITQAKDKAGVVKLFPNFKDEPSFQSILAKVTKAQKLATVQAVAGADYIKVVEELAGARIPFQIFFDMDDHRILLAESTAQPKRKKK